jgi:hypothetical protein
MTQNKIQQKFQAAFDSFLEKVKADPAIIAVYLYGSLVRGDMWDGSDLDVYAITRDERAPRKMVILVENGITFHCDVVSRSQFRCSHERMLRGSIPHHIFTSGKLVYTTDDSLYEYYQEMSSVGERDREMLALYYGTAAIAFRHSVRKSLYAHQDNIYMFIWLFEVIRYMACIEIVLQGELIQREVLHQAIRLNPDVFKPIINGLLQGDKDLEALQKIFERVEAYMEANATLIFKPLLEYLSAEGEVRGISEIFQHLASRLLMEENSLLLFDSCNWLVEIGILQAVDNPIKLTPKSRVAVNEPAYYYDGD